MIVLVFNEETKGKKKKEKKCREDDHLPNTRLREVLLNRGVGGGVFFFLFRFLLLCSKSFRQYLN